MGILAKLFGSDKIIQAGIDGIDAMVYTDEEKVTDKLSLLKLYEPFKIAQRWLMVIVSAPYMLCWVVTFIATFFGVDTMHQEAMLEGSVGNVFWTISGFYFGGGLVEGAIKTYKGNK